MSFGKSTVDGGNTDEGNEGVASSNNLDPCDPSVMAAILSNSTSCGESSFAHYDSIR